MSTDYAEYFSRGSVALELIWIFCLFALTTWTAAGEH